MKKRTSTILKVIIAVSVVAGIGFMVKNYIGNKVEKASNSYSMYNTAPVQRMDLETYIRGSGLFTSFNTADMKLDEGVKIIERYVEDGNAVSMNQAVFLANNGYESYYVKSPIAGLFFERQNENNTPSYQVYDITNTGVSISVSEENVVKLKLGQSVKVLFTAIDKTLDGKLTHISKVADNGAFAVRIHIPYSDDLRFGYNTSIKIITASKKQTLCVPYNTVQHEGDKAFVIKEQFLEELNKTNVITDNMKTYIKTGASDNNYVEVLEGLSDKDQVVAGSQN